MNNNAQEITKAKIAGESETDRFLATKWIRLRLKEASIALDGCADEARKGASTCEHCRLIVARYEVPRG